MPLRKPPHKMKKPRRARLVTIDQRGLAVSRSYVIGRGRVNCARNDQRYNDWASARDATAWSRSKGWTGLARYTWKPAASASSASPRRAYAVSAMAGTWMFELRSFWTNA